MGGLDASFKLIAMGSVCLGARASWLLALARLGEVARGRGRGGEVGEARLLIVFMLGSLG